MRLCSSDFFTALEKPGIRTTFWLITLHNSNSADDSINTGHPQSFLWIVRVPLLTMLISALFLIMPTLSLQWHMLAHIMLWRGVLRCPFLKIIYYFSFFCTDHAFIKLLVWVHLKDDKSNQNAHLGVQYFVKVHCWDSHSICYTNLLVAIDLLWSSVY